MVSSNLRWQTFAVFACAMAIAFVPSSAEAQQAAPTASNSAPQSPPPDAARKTANWRDRLTDSLFLTLDKNHDKMIDEAELKSEEAARYRDDLKSADRDGSGKISLEEYRRIGEVPFYRDIKTVAAVLLTLSFACFCVFLDGLLEPDRRDYFLLTIGGSVVLAGLAYLFATEWYLNAEPFLGFVAAIPLLVIVLAFLTGATKEKEEEVAPSGPVVYKVGKPTAEGTPAPKPGQPAAPRKSTAPIRTPRPAPLPRPPVPERRPQSPPRAQPPRPSGPPPGSGPKPPPKK